jgi:hypothetical protein
MPVYDAANVPDRVGRGTLDPELEAWLPSGPALGADVPIAQGRRGHMPGLPRRITGSSGITWMSGGSSHPKSESRRAVRAATLRSVPDGFSHGPVA